MNNALSIDLEDWFCVYNLSQVIKREDWEKQELRVVQNTERILNLLDRHQVTATFFVLGWIAEHVPELIAEIERRGHEIATHGYSHTVITAMTPEAFESDLKKAIGITRALIHQDILGYRAPSFTITPKTMWAIDVLTRNGIRYDSSVFPISYHPDYGVPDAPLTIYRHNDALIEFPLTCVKMMGKVIPCCGGGYFRIFPYFVTRYLLRRVNREGRPAIFYFHPWEIDPDQPRVKLPWQKTFRHYFNLKRTFDRLDRLLSDFKFISIRELLGL